jgi:hypothetical protein
VTDPNTWRVRVVRVLVRVRVRVRAFACVCTILCANLPCVRFALVLCV